MEEVGNSFWEENVGSVSSVLKENAFVSNRYLGIGKIVNESRITQRFI
jgi:hypothetical protein